MIPIFKENGLIWTLLDTSNIPNILLYSFDSTLSSMKWREDRLKLINYENI